MTVLAEADRLGLRVEAELIGPTMRVRLLRDGAPVALGYGKGRGAQGTVSAYAEALERYLMSARDNRRFSSHNTVLSAASTVAAQPALAADLVVQRWAAEFPAAPAACAEYHGPAGRVRYPTFLADPRYYGAPVAGDSVEPYRSLLRYASSLGTAAGLTVTEAVYHGLCELIEHDAVSLALLRWFVAGRPEVDVVAPAALPPSLRALHDEATAVAGAGVQLLDLTTDLGVPVYLAVSGPDLLGAGASTWGSYAAERALSELIQTATLARETTAPRPPIASPPGPRCNGAYGCRSASWARCAVWPCVATPGTARRRTGWPGPAGCSATAACAITCASWPRPIP